jgi:hypothetical protein
LPVYALNPQRGRSTQSHPSCTYPTPERLISIRILSYPDDNRSESLYHSPHSSSFFAPPLIPPPVPPFFIALVPMPLGFFGAIPPPVFVSPALANSSQKSCLSFAGPLGAAPKLSQKSLRSGSRRPDVAGECVEESPSTNRVNCVFAFATPD